MDENDAIDIGKKIIEENWIPLIKISNKTGFNIDKLKLFLSYLPVLNDT